MSKSWVTLIVVALAFLIVITGYQIYQSFTGGVEKKYVIDDIEGTFGDETLEFVKSKESEIEIREGDI